MSQAPARHPFLDDLADDVVFLSSALRAPVTGRDRVRAIVKTGGSLYQRQNPVFLGHVEDRGLFEYEVELLDGIPAYGLVSFQRNAAGAVTHLHIAFSPLGANMAIAAELRDRLSGEFGPELFL